MFRCVECRAPLDPRLGRTRHPNPRCDPGPAWWERPEWQEWLRAAALRPTETPSQNAASGPTPAGVSEET